MYVMTIDQRGSRTRGDEVPGLLRTLQQVRTVREFLRTIGDEIQGVLDAPEEVATAVRLCAVTGDWHIGVGIGGIEEPLPATSSEARGDAFYAARRAVEAAKSAPANLVVDDESLGDPRSGSQMSENAHRAQSSLRLMVRVIGTLRPESRRYIEHRLTHPDATQEEIAAHFHVTQQAVSRVLSRGTAEIISGGQDLAVHHLSQAGTHVV